MSGITSDVGLMSGINTRDLIDQLMAIESQPLTRMQTRIATLELQQTAYMDINARLLALKSSSQAFRTQDIFQSAKATSSNADILSATASSDAALGTYNMTVNRLVSTHQLISRGFADKDSGAVGATEFSFEIGGGQLATDTELSLLNGGSGIDRGKILIEDSQGNSVTIDLSTVTTVNEVLDAINSKGSIEVTASIDDDHFVITDDNGGTVSISDVYGDSTATSLGLVGTGAGSVVGSSVFYLSEDTALSVLNDGTGVLMQDGPEVGTQDIKITVNGRSENSAFGELTPTDADDETVVVQARATTLGDVIDRINDAFDGEVTAAIAADGKSIELTAADAGHAIQVEESGSGTTARDLGLLGSSTGTHSGSALVSGMNTTLIGSLNGGLGLNGGSSISITDRDGNSFAGLDVSGYVSVQELVDGINSQAQASGVSVTASLNSSGNGILLTDSSGGAGNLQVSGDAADALNLTADVAAATVNSGNLQTRYVSEATLLSELNHGDGIGTGSFTIYDAYGASSTVTISDSIRTVHDLVALINSRGVEVEAAVNDQGDGIVITATDNGDGQGSQAIRIEDGSGKVAAKLNLVGEASGIGADNYIDGSNEQTVSFEDTDSLQDIADAINAENIGVQAVIINDGTGAQPYHLSFVSTISGVRGSMTVDTGDLDFGLSTLTEAQDAVVFFGSGDPADAVLLTSDSNTLDDAIEGVSIDLNGTSDDPVELVVSRDTTKIEDSINAFVEAFNGVIARIEFYDSYDTDNEQRGTLLGDTTVNQLRTRLYSTVQGEPTGVDGEFSYLFEVGVSVGDEGKLEFDRDKFRDALESDPEGVADLFGARESDTSNETDLGGGVTVNEYTETFTSLGVAELLAELADDFTDSFDGFLIKRNESLGNMIKLQRDA
ncbi:MAG: flagellar filament capping protein FliD, partial [Phycisphaerales bacterium JB038]